MQVASTRPGTQLQRRRAAAHDLVALAGGTPAPPAVAAPPRAAKALPAALRAPLVLPEQLDLGPISKADGAWDVDWKRAHADAQRVLAKIDFTRPDVMLWVPGTDAKGVHHDLRIAARYLYGAQQPSLQSVDYEASWELRRSLPTGLATLKLVLAGIEQRFAQLEAAGRPRPRLLLAGLSQGAWIIGEAIADPRLGKVVTRAVLAGHPWLAAHQYDKGEDPRVRVINHRGDQITMHVAGSAAVGLDAMIAVRTGKLGQQLGTVLKAIAANPLHGVLLLHTQLREREWIRPYVREPHEYGFEMPRMVEYLRTGVLDQTNEELDDIKRAQNAAAKAAAARG